jgi:nitrate reductase NapAB chaperone NapD
MLTAIMAICSYLVIPRDGRAASLARQLAALPGCDVARAENREVLVLVTETANPEAEAALRERIAGLDEVRSLVLTFGEIDPDASPPLPPRHG